MISEQQIYSKRILTMLPKGISLVCINLLICFSLFAQYTIRFEVYDPTQKSETFLAGSFNNWNPADNAYKLIVLDTTHKYIILKNISPGKYQFKFTRGTWSTVESSATGVSINNRIIEIKKDTTLQLHIAGWIDDINDTSAFIRASKFIVRFDVYDPTKKNETFLAWSFNNFNPGDSRYKLTILDPTHKSITIKGIPSGKYFFKFTRGNWGTVESTAMGDEIDDRIIEIRKDTVVQLSIAGWVDDYVDLSKFPDSISIKAGWLRSFYYREINLDSSYKYALYSFELSKKVNEKKSEISSLLVLGEVYQKQGNSAKALELFLQASPIAEALHDSFHLALVYNNIGNIFESENEYAKAKYYYHNAIKYTSLFDIRAVFRQKALLSLGKIYFNTSKLDSANYYARLSNDIQWSTVANLLLGDIEKKLGNKTQAMAYYRQSVAHESLTNNSSMILAEAYQRLAREFTENNQPDSGFYYARLSFAIAKQVKNPFGIVAAGNLLTNLFEKGKRFDSAFFYQQIVLKTNDSLFSKEKEKEIQNLVFNEQLHKQEIKAEKEKYRSRTWIYALGGGLAVLLLTALLLIRNNKQKKEANILLGRQKQQIENTLTELKATQSQLIQSEKMASLGELTAGIAHEIQNPLNFVNNFSELNTELIEEMQQEMDKGNLEDAKLISNDIKENEQKINHHGKRADAIVKGMLRHSRSSSGVKEPININALADEYLRLAHHGLRAKDKSFNAEIKTDFDTTIEKINIVPQDIGRVLLNLITNSFYAVTEKKKQQPEGYEPTVSVGTKKINDKVEIIVQDNGNGIPQKVLDKIFQPFFTTKPTGQGTGLGLSMSYDIIKAHGGEIKVETKEGEGAKFIIQLPGIV